MIEKVSVCVGFHGVVAEERMTLTWLFGNSIYPGPALRSCWHEVA